ncbi:putative membrane protein [Dermabacter hominis]
MTVPAPPSPRRPAALWMLFSGLALAMIPVLPVIILFLLSGSPSPSPQGPNDVGTYAKQFDSLVESLKSLAVLIVCWLVGTNLLALFSFPFAFTALKRCTRKVFRTNIRSLIYFVVGPVIAFLSFVVLLVLYLVMINVLDAATSNNENARNVAVPFVTAAFAIPPLLDIARFVYLFFASIRVYLVKPSALEEAP